VTPCKRPFFRSGRLSSAFCYPWPALPCCSGYSISGSDPAFVALPQLVRVSKCLRLLRPTWIHFVRVLIGLLRRRFASPTMQMHLVAQRGGFARPPPSSTKSKPYKLDHFDEPFARIRYHGAEFNGERFDRLCGISTLAKPSASAMVSSVPGCRRPGRNAPG